MNARPQPNPDLDARRGEAARQALIDAGIELFGRRGLEGATTRDIARVAGQNIAAIPYYFGSKEGLYLAVAAYLLDTIVERAMPLIESTEALLADGRARPAALLHALRNLSGGLVMMFTREETLAMSRIISREQTDPTAVFDMFYERAISRAHRCMAGLLDQYSGIDSGPIDSVLRAHVLLGSILGFRVAAATVLRRAGWAGFGTQQVDQIERVACEHAEMYARALRGQERKRRAAIAQAPARKPGSR